jgi:hypothetical protein
MVPDFYGRSGNFRGPTVMSSPGSGLVVRGNSFWKMENVYHSHLKWSRFIVDIEDMVGETGTRELETENCTEDDAKTLMLREDEPWYWGDLFMYFKAGPREIRLGRDQDLHGGTVYVRPESEEASRLLFIYFEDQYEKGNIEGTNLCDALKRVKEQFARRAESRGEPRLRRGLRQLERGDEVGNEILTMDWTDQKRTCRIKIWDEIFKTVVDEARDIIMCIEAEYGLQDLYMCDDDGEPVDHQT